MLTSVVFPRPDSPAGMACFSQTPFKHGKYKQLTNNHDSEMRAALCNNLVSLQNAKSHVALAPI